MAEDMEEGMVIQDTEVMVMEGMVVNSREETKGSRPD